jgi:hypothetical protein
LLSEFRPESRPVLAGVSVLTVVQDRIETFRVMASGGAQPAGGKGGDTPMPLRCDA